MAATIDIVAKFQDEASVGVRGMADAITTASQQAAGDVSNLTEKVRELRERTDDLATGTAPATQSTLDFSSALSSIIRIAPEVIRLYKEAGTETQTIADATLKATTQMSALGGAVSLLGGPFKIAGEAISLFGPALAVGVSALAEWSVATEKTTVDLKKLGVTEEEATELTKKYGNAAKRAADQARDGAKAEREAREDAAKAAREQEKALREQEKTTTFLTKVERERAGAAHDLAIAQARASGDAIKAAEAEFKKKKDLIEREKDERLDQLRALKTTVEEESRARVEIEQRAADDILAAETKLTADRAREIKKVTETEKAELEKRMAEVRKKTKEIGDEFDRVNEELKQMDKAFWDQVIENERKAAEAAASFAQAQADAAVVGTRSAALVAEGWQGAAVAMAGAGGASQQAAFQAATSASLGARVAGEAAQSAQDLAAETREATRELERQAEAEERAAAARERGVAEPARPGPPSGTTTRPGGGRGGGGGAGAGGGGAPVGPAGRVTIQATTATITAGGRDGLTITLDGATGLGQQLTSQQQRAAQRRAG
jgi:hypothetical protein